MVDKTTKYLSRTGSPVPITVPDNIASYRSLASEFTDTATSSGSPRTGSVSSTESTRKAKRTSFLVNASGAGIILLLIIYFLMILNNMSSIAEHVEDRKDGAYPASIAAGHIETDLAQIKSMSHFLASLNGARYDTGAFRENLTEIDTNVDYYIRELRAEYNDPLNIVGVLSVDYDLLIFRMHHLFDLYDNPQVSDEELDEYVTNSINPVVDKLLEIDNDILDETKHDVDNLYDFVNNAVRLTIIMSLVLMVASLLTTFVYTVLLRRKEHQEQKLNTNLRKALIAAEQASEAKSAFLGNMSHDIRTPLNAIIGLTTIAQDSVDDPKRIEHLLGQINTSSHQLLRLVNDTLDLTKIERGKTELTMEVFSLTELMSDIKAITKPQATERKLSIEYAMDDITNDTYEGDVMRIRQILLNIVGNALKYTKEGGSVWVSVAEQPTAEDLSDSLAKLVFTVRDTGVGMDPLFLKKIFEPFERERNEYTNFVEGTGLGMAIAHNLVTMMGGNIHVESEVGVGSKFTVKIPLKIVRDVAAGEGAKTSVSAKGVEGSNGATPIASGSDASTNSANSDGEASDRHASSATSINEEHERGDQDDPTNKGERGSEGKTVSAEDGKIEGRVLVVDDNDINMEIASELIRRFGPEVEKAYDGIEAIEMVEQHPEGYYDLIFMDWQMPRMNGIDATKHIVKFFEESGWTPTPIVAMTANAFNEDRRAAMKAGMVGFMAKPINVGELEENLREFL